MSDNRINDQSPAHFLQGRLDLPYLRELFIAPETSQRADIYHIKENTNKTNQLLFENLSLLGTRNNERVSSAAEIIEGYQASTDQVGDELFNIESSLDMGFDQLYRSMQGLYGTNLPEDTPITTIAKKATDDSKKTLVSMYVRGAVRRNDIAHFFSQNFINYLHSGKSYSDAQKEQRNIDRYIEELTGRLHGFEKYKAQINEHLDNLPSNRKNESLMEQYKDDNRKYGKLITDSRSAIKILQSQLINDEELRFLKVAERSKNKVNNIFDLIDAKCIDPKSLEVFVRKGLIRGDAADQLARVIHTVEGEVKPLVELNGITGIFQQNKVQSQLQNILVDQNADIWYETKDINNNIIGISSTLEESNNIANQGLAKLDNIHQSVEKGTSALENIDRSIGEGNELKQEQLNLDKTNTTANLYTAQNTEYTVEQLRSIHGQIKNSNLIQEENLKVNYDSLAVNKINTLANRETADNTVELVNLGHISAKLSHIQVQQNNAILEELSDIHNGIRSIYAGLEEGNDYLEQIDEGLQDMTMALYETNTHLTHIDEQIEFTRESLIKALGDLQTGIVEGLTALGDHIGTRLERTNELLGYQVTLQQFIFDELQHQSTLLSSIDQKLLRPYAIKANEKYQIGVEWLEAGNTEQALDSFLKGIHEQSNHFANILGAAFIYKGKNKWGPARKYFSFAQELAQKDRNNSLAAKLAIECSKANQQLFKRDTAIRKLDEAIALDGSNLDAYFLKARLLLQSNNKNRLAPLLYTIYHKIFEQGNESHVSQRYDDVMSLLQDQVNAHIENQIQYERSALFMKHIYSLEKVLTPDQFLKVMTFCITNSANDLRKTKYNVHKYINLHKIHFEKIYRMVKFGAIDTPCHKFQYYNMAYRGYKNIDQNIVFEFVSQGLSYDKDYILFKKGGRTDVSLQNKIARGFEKIGKHGKTLLQEYVKAHHIF